MPPLDTGGPVIVLPGLGGSDADHWQSWFERETANTGRISEVDWHRPELSNWIDRFLKAVRTRPNSLLVAHSLGCALVAHAVAHHGELDVRGAMLVAPADVDASPAIPGILHSFMGVPRRKLPFPSLLIASSNDPYMSPQRAEHFASAWGAQLINLGARGHINVASGFGPWPEGLQLLSDFASGLAPQPLPTNISINTNQTERA